ncbi:2-acylglycerol O-acyltransferase 2-A-like [Pollicipes pollicipes]|uniref:2-acylglycerol O-acyltransferase 2-A-like n=1 Tax=Pollicipes pollicipes TaxID=41117 RepID=UPI0018857D50|nr:2-acylglycerol O-acyltransferase 2-A-like [Pollicipes pollicipes]
MKILGIQFAPWRIPWQRRLQTSVVASWISTFVFMGLGGLLLLAYLLLFTRFWWVSVAYAGWFWYDKDACNRGGRRWQWVRRWQLWRHFRDYFPVRLVKTCDFSPDENYLVGSHPHGVLCAGAFCNFCTEGNDFSGTFPGITPHMLTLEGNYSQPFYRELFMATGGVAATKRSMEYLLSLPTRGHMLVLVVGGAPEALMARPGVSQLYINRRKGFIKIALRFGVSLVPVFHFGETDVYTQVWNPEGSRLRRWQEWLMHYIGLAPVLFLGRGMLQYNFGIVPFRRPVTTVLGRPIPVQKSADPSQQQIDELHERYKVALKELYDTHRHKYALDPTVELEFK